MKQRADMVRKAIMKYCVSDKAPGAAGPILVFSTDGQISTFQDVSSGITNEIASARVRYRG